MERPDTEQSQRNITCRCSGQLSNIIYRPTLFTFVCAHSSAVYSTAKSLGCCCFSDLVLLFKSRASFALIAINLVLTAYLAEENQLFINNETHYYL